MDEAERGLVSLVIGYQIRRCRQSRHLSQAEVAQGIGSQSMISLLESGRQIPAPDVLRLIAERLDDPVLLSYAGLLNSTALTFDDFATGNLTLLHEVLRAHRGRWQEVHLKVALQLCEHYYTNKLFEMVEEMCCLIMSHTNRDIGSVKACFYYGSTHLFSHQYDLALKWLNLALEKYDVLDDCTKGRLYYNLAYAHLELLNDGAAIWYAKLAIDTFLRINAYPQHAKSLGLLGVIQGQLGQLEDARPTLERAYEMMERWDVDQADLIRVANSIADVCQSTGDLNAAEQWCRLVIDSTQAAPDYPTLSAAHQTLCLVHMGRAECKAALAEAQLAIAAAERAVDARLLCHAYLLATSTTQNPLEQVTAAEHAYRTARESGLAIEQAISADCLAALLAPHDPSRAETFRSQALQSYRQYVSRGRTFSAIFRYLRWSELYES